mgnify:CR=1 FL=1
MLKTLSKIALIASLQLFAACSDKVDSYGNQNSGSEDTAKDKKSNKPKARFALIPTGLRNARKSNAFALTAPATSYSIFLDECQSGYTSTATEISTDLQVYKFDQDCLAKLTQFQVNTITYSATATGATDFTSWLVNDTAVFANTVDSTDTVGVKVVAQLSSPVLGVDTVSYTFYDIEAGADNDDLTPTVLGAGHTMTVDGLAALSFTIEYVRYQNITATGEGEFEFSLQCTVPLTNGNTTCKDVTLTDIDYKLVDDTFTSTVTLTDADGIFNTAGTSVLAGHRVNVGGTDSAGNVLAKGGFYTSTTSRLQGPGKIHLNQHMILIFRAGNSYLYFNVDHVGLDQD